MTGTRKVLFALLFVSATWVFAAPSGPSTQPVPPVVYLSHSEPLSVSEKVPGRIAEMASSSAVLDKRIWFMAVVANGPEGSKVEVFYAPDQTTARLRKGRFVCIPGLAVGEYAQVSSLDKPFTKELDVPNRADLPFPWPYVLNKYEAEGHRLALKDEDLVRLVDAARAMRKPKPDDDPICMIRGGELWRSVPGAINVLWGVSSRFGTQDDDVPHAGGVYLQFKRDRDTYNLADRGTWDVDEKLLPRYQPDSVEGAP